ncbi:hypothetical protein DWZ35_23355, partial [Bacteroides caccae]
MKAKESITVITLSHLSGELWLFDITFNANMQNKEKIKITLIYSYLNNNISGELWLFDITFNANMQNKEKIKITLIYSYLNNNIY